MRRIEAGCLLIPILLSACSLSHRAVRKHYVPFNETIHYNQSQEMLLNLVRLRYRETPMFFKVGALSTSYSFEANAGANLGKSFGQRTYGLNVGSAVASRPTITYTPIEGNTFVRQILAEVDPNTFVLLFRSGWPIETLCYLIVEGIGDAFNREDESSLREFSSIVAKLQAAFENQELDFLQSGEEIFVKLGGKPGGGQTFEGAEADLIPFSSFQLRSFLDIMFYLSKNTEIPGEHADRVKDTKGNNWLTIRASTSPPDDALVWVVHEGYVFSISARDIRSKDTFALLKLLFQIQAGDISTVQPLLTLPVARP